MIGQNIYEGIEAYRTYVAIKSHFTSSYDYHRYKGKVNVKDTTYLKRKDKKFFRRLQLKYKKEELVYYFLANILMGDTWVGNFREENFTLWKKRIQSLTYNFKKDCAFIFESIDNPNDILKVNDSHPLLLKYFLTNTITLETLTILDDMLNFSPYWDKHFNDDIVVSNVLLTMEKYKGFLQYNKEKYQKILKDSL